MLTFLLLITTVLSQNCEFPQNFNLVYGGIQLYECDRNDWNGITLNTNVTGIVYQKLSTHSRNGRTKTYTREIGIIGQSFKFIQDRVDEITIRFTRRTSKYGRGKDEKYLLEYNCQSPLCRVTVKAQEGSAIQLACSIINFILAIWILLL